MRRMPRRDFHFRCASCISPAHFQTSLDVDWNAIASVVLMVSLRDLIAVSKVCVLESEAMVSEDRDQRYVSQQLLPLIEVRR